MYNYTELGSVFATFLRVQQIHMVNIVNLLTPEILKRQNGFQHAKSAQQTPRKQFKPITIPKNVLEFIQLDYQKGHQLFLRNFLPGPSVMTYRRTPESHLRGVCRSRLKFWNFRPRYVFFRIKIAGFWKKYVRNKRINFCKDGTLCRSPDTPKILGMFRIWAVFGYSKKKSTKIF